MIFKERLEAPNVGDKFYTHYENGGVNICKKIDSSNGFVMPNCVGYAHGRILELRNEQKANWSLPAGNAEDWIAIAIQNKWVGNYGNQPKLGAAIVWSQGAKKNGSDGAGHVAIVERINSDGSLFVSESGYNSYLFKTETIPANYSRSGMKFEGFVYCGIEFEAPKVDPAPAQSGLNESSYPDYPNGSGKYYRVKDKSGKQLGAYSVWKNAYKKWNSDHTQHIYDDNGKQLDGVQIAEQPKKALTSSTYPNYTDGKSYYRVRTSWKGGSQLGAYSVWLNAYSAWQKYKNQGYHVFDNSGNQLD